MEKVKRFLKFDLWIMLLDIVAVNAAYLLALLIRFYVNYKFTPSIGQYLDYFYKFTPFYTVLCIIVFYLFRLYGGMWTYAGLNDMNRIIGASVVTAILHVAGTLLFVARMPISYYIIGGFLQFIFIFVIRFVYRFYLLEKERIEKKHSASMPAMVIGSGAQGRRVVHDLEKNTPYRVAVIVGVDSGRTINGVPVVSMSETASQIKNKDIKAIFVADESLSRADREAITQAAEGIDIMDYTGYISNMTGTIPVAVLMEYVDGPVTVVIEGEERRFKNARECVRNLTGHYEVSSITASRIELKHATTDNRWMQEYKKQTGEDVSFF